jgi:hypothetical protein
MATTQHLQHTTTLQRLHPPVLTAAFHRYLEPGVWVEHNAKPVLPSSYLSSTPLLVRGSLPSPITCSLNRTCAVCPLEAMRSIGGCVTRKRIRRAIHMDVWGQSLIVTAGAAYRITYLLSASNAPAGNNFTIATAWSATWGSQTLESLSNPGAFTSWRTFTVYAPSSGTTVTLRFTYRAPVRSYLVWRECSLCVCVCVCVCVCECVCVCVCVCGSLCAVCVHGG